jgi:hypothetical protein
VDVPIREIIAGSTFEKFVKEAIGGFCCRDEDVEMFLKEKAFDFEKRDKSRTYLIFQGEKLLSYFSLSLKALRFGESLSKNMIKNIDGFSKNVRAQALILIGQFGKDRNHGKAVSGDALLEKCLETVYNAQKIVGGRYVLLECQDEKFIVDFYTRNRFEILQRDEKDKYLQMVRRL